MNKLLDWVAAFACSALMAAALVGLAYVAFAPRSAFAARRVGTLLTQRDVETRVAVFTVPVNAEDSDEYTGFELRASTDGFSTLKYFGHSDVADLASPGRDGMWLFVCTSKAGSDARAYTPIESTLAWTNRLTSVVAVVDASRLAVCPGGDWLRGGNSALSWSYRRSRPVSPAFEREDGTEEGQWRPIFPTWYRSMPEWAGR